MADKLRRYQAIRQSCINEIQTLNNLAVKAQTDTSQRTLFKIRFDDAENVRDEFTKQHSNILLILSSDQNADINAEDKTKETFNQSYYSAKAIYTELFESERTPPAVQPDPNPSILSHAKLPKIDLIKFSGDLICFPTFKDMFDALVHNRSSLKDIEKFSYLLSALQGPPLSLAKRLPMVAENYQTTYDTLVKRYTNVRLLANSYWSEIENCRKIDCSNAQDLRKLLDTFAENLSALTNIGFPVDSWNFILVNMLIKKIDSETAQKFEVTHDSTEVPQYTALFEFLDKHYVALNTVSFSSQTNKFKRLNNNNNTSKSPTNVNRNSFNQSFLSRTENSHLKCNMCDANHLLFNCPAFINKSPSERFNFCKRLHLCFNCLSHIHDLKTCNSVVTCKKCGLRHHTLLHLGKSNSAGGSNNNLNTPTISHPPQDENQPSTSRMSMTSSATTPFSGVLLSTALVEIRDRYGIYHQCKALLDSGSQISIISQNCHHLLGLKKFRPSFSVKGLGQTVPIRNAGAVTLHLKPAGQESPVFMCDALILPTICDKLPSTPLKATDWSHLHGLKLADSDFRCPGEIDILLGADIYPQLLLDGHVSGKFGEPYAINTVLGYVLLGKIECSPSANINISFLTTYEEDRLESSIKKFWEIESVPEMHSLSPEDQLCENIFVESCQRDDTGRFILSLPFRDSSPTFPEIRSLAIKRFFALERRLLREPRLHEEYCNFMQEYLDLRHMEVVSDTRLPNCHYYIPHHCVVKPNSISTKLRVVFNASARMPNQPSLNDCLYVGPKLQNDILTILLNFRVHKVCFTADIRQMYRQILISPRDKDYQRIIWRFSPLQPIQDFKLCTVTYGLAPSPFLAIRTLHQLSHEDGRDFPAAALVIQNDTYIDDIVTGSSSLSEAIHLRDELISLLQRGCFELRKWSSNDPSLLSIFPESHLSMHPLSFNQESDSLMVLGLQWNPLQDNFLFRIEPLDRSCTKRPILSELARVYDPLGIIAPVTFFTKCLIQRMWILGLDWDEPPSDDILRSWNQYKAELPLLSQIGLPRRLINDNFVSLEIHGFADAACGGYAGVVYFRVSDELGNFSTYFVCAKSKVAPLKCISIPRLELCAALLLSKMIAFVSKIYKSKLEFNNIVAWSDSQITLSWIKSSPHRWKTFVANRVALIQDKVPPSCWHYVESQNNPADPASRGLFPSELVNHQLWFQGPAFLRSPDTLWPISTKFMPFESLHEEERISSLVAFVENNIMDDLLNHYSSFSLLQRVLAYMLRFKFNIYNPTAKRIEPLFSSKFSAALVVLVRHTQAQTFSNELDNKLFSKPLKKLNAFVDDGVLWVGGRLNYSHLSYDKKHPILLPRSSRLTELLIDYYHKKFLHAGLHTTQFLLSQKFWILSPRRAIRSVLPKCVKCFRAQPKPFQPLMGNLPFSRISEVKSFSHSVVDYAGPILITMSRQRGSKSIKAYICLFVWCATKVVHIELGSNLSSDAFLAVLRTFTTIMALTLLMLLLTMEAAATTHLIQGIIYSTTVRAVTGTFKLPLVKLCPLPVE